MLRHEGPAAFAKGLVPTMLQTAPYTSIQFGAFEIFNRLANSLHLRESVVGEGRGSERDGWGV